MSAELERSWLDDEAAVRAVETSVRAVEAAYDAAWNAGDLASLLRLLTEDVVIINPYGEVSVGRDAVETSFSALFDGVARDQPTRRTFGRSAF